MSSGDIVPVVIETAFGNIEIDINTGAAPITAGNFLAHVDEGLYDGGIFHRSVTLENQRTINVATSNPDYVIEVIQGGISPEKLPDNLKPIPLERTKDTGLLHLDGAISMARGSADRYFQKDAASDKLVPEGIEGQVPYKGLLKDFVFQLMGGLRSGMGYVGAETVADLRTKARFIEVSAASVRENHPHDIAITQEAPNYTVEHAPIDSV